MSDMEKFGFVPVGPDYQRAELIPFAGIRVFLEGRIRQLRCKPFFDHHKEVMACKYVACLSDLTVNEEPLLKTDHLWCPVTPKVYARIHQEQNSIAHTATLIDREDRQNGALLKAHVLVGVYKYWTGRRNLGVLDARHFEITLNGERHELGGRTTVTNAGHHREQLQMTKDFRERNRHDA